MDAYWAAMAGHQVACAREQYEEVRAWLVWVRTTLPDDDLGSVPLWRQNLTAAINQLDHAHGLKEG